MDEVTVSSLGITWDEVITFLKTSALDFGIALITAIVIFYVGRVVVRMITRGIRKVMDARQVDKTLVTFVSNLVNMILINAIKKGASDIHIEPFEHEVRIKYRVDGIIGRGAVGVEEDPVVPHRPSSTITRSSTTAPWARAATVIDRRCRPGPGGV